ncbi:SDR family oxidoreductase [Streptomyces africanus]|uniref:SDR family oxidoreductase n=1 Tax=Streptomyces africanus TaxID=231024 RepID=UPI001ABEEF5C|nr:NmrA family NAD(P)-binding protein [Streptomyces africanus]
MSESEAVRSQEPPLIAVIGAAGLCGTYVLEAALRAPFRVRAVVHGPSGRERVAALGVDDIVEADLEEPDAVRQALKNADFVFMIPPAFHPEEDVLAIRALEAAEQEGARRFVYLSVLHPHTPGLRHHLRKANAEAAVRASGLNWTILQPSMFAQIVLSTWGRAPAGHVNVPFNVGNEFSFIDLRDLGEAGVKVLSEQGHDSATYELAGPALTLAEAVRFAGRARGVDLEARTVDWAAAPLPPGVADSASRASDMRAMWQDYDRHGLRGNSNVLRMLLGREPASFEEAATAFAARG